MVEEEVQSARFTWNISCQRGKRGGHSPPRSACPPPTNAATGRGRRCRSMVHLLPDREGVLNFECSLGFPLSLSAVHFPASRRPLFTKSDRGRRPEAVEGVAFYRTTPHRRPTDRPPHLSLSPHSLCISPLPSPPSASSSRSRAYRSLSRRRFPPLAHPPPRFRAVNPQHRAQRAQLGHRRRRLFPRRVALQQRDQEGPTEL